MLDVLEMIRGYLDVLCSPYISVRGVGNEFAVLDVLASKINVSLVRRSVVIRVD